ncbi:MAG: hypothetical protein ACKOAD_07950 [Gammaproteobacteria bacterium]
MSKQNKIVSKACLTTLIGLASVLPTIANADDFYFKPYVGFGIENRHMDFKKNYGNGFFKKNQLNYIPFVGVDLHENLALEMGYQLSKKMNYDKKLVEGDYLFGEYVDDVQSGYRTRGFYKMKGFNLDAIGKYPVFCDTTFVFARVGVKFAKLKLEHDTYQDAAGIPTPAASTTVKASKVIPRLGLGLDHQVYADESMGDLGIRLNTIWEKTSAIKIRKFTDSDLQGEPVLQPKLKNSISYGMDLYWKF